ncbi:hypothetical protein Q8W25_17610 [Shimia thalassica]|uniref:hypothetical protein n=1 Tax=Shimia thalassica TaxID=1715693 RepID=UPI002735B0A2|nr:hypothetical protein [Shimia thalassica]MDP2495849.1 hypothetical protein [Shimia thalassica]
MSVTITHEGGQIVLNNGVVSHVALDAAVVHAAASAAAAQAVADLFSAMIGEGGESLTVTANMDPALLLHEVSQDSTSRIYNNGYHLYLEHTSLPGGNALIELDPLPVDEGGHAVVRVGRSYQGSGDVRFSILPGGDVTTPEWEFNATSNSYILRNQQGNLGLGTATPQRFFHMAHADPIMRLQDTDEAGVYAEIRADGSAGRVTISADQGGNADGSFISFLVDGQEHVRLNENGQLAIGTATGQRLLHIAGEDPIIRLQDTDTAGLYSEIRADGAAGRLTLSADVSGAGTGSFMSLFVSGQERARIDNEGRLGIGTTSPQRQVHIAGDDPIIRLQDGDDGVFSELRAEGPSGRFSISVDPSASGAGDSYFSILIDGTEQMTIDPNGNVDVRNGHIELSGQKIIEARKTGWAVPSGTANRGSFTTSTATVEELAERLKAVIDDLRGHGLIGA